MPQHGSLHDCTVLHLSIWEREPRQSSSRHDHMGQEGHTPPDVVGSETVELATVAAATAAVTSTFDADT